MAPRRHALSAPPEDPLPRDVRRGHAAARGPSRKRPRRPLLRAEPEPRQGARAAAAVEVREQLENQAMMWTNTRGESRTDRTVRLSRVHALFLAEG